jgi:hypothetical protein
MPINNADFIDTLLDKWDDASGNYFANITAGLNELSTDFAPSTTSHTDLLKKLQELYLVFHYPHYDTSVGEETKFNPAPRIDDKTTVFNYISGPSDRKRLLSSTGISKINMVKLKMLIGDLIKTVNANGMIKILTTLNNDFANVGDITNTSTTTLLGGNNSAGGKSKNRSNKRIKKQLRKRNKSSKSII